MSKKTRKKKTVNGLLCAILVLGILLAVELAFILVHLRKPKTDDSTGFATTAYISDLPWENGGKQPEEFTWEEFEALTPDQQEAFFLTFDTAEEFEKWMLNVKPETEPTETEAPRLELPWENGGKQPAEYTWEEFEALTPEQQEAFFLSFDTAEAFEEWMENAQPETTDVPQSDLPWENGGKQPSEYTWEEFEALTPEQQEAFFLSFDTEEEFEAWLAQACPDEE